MKLKKVFCLFLALSFSLFAKEIDLLESARTSQPINVPRHKDDTYRLYLKPLHQSIISFGDEVVEYAETGDNVSFNTMEDTHSVRVKVSDENLRTDLVVKTNQDIYYFKVKSSNGIHNPVVNFIYPQKIEARRKHIEKTTEPVLAINLNELNNQYTISKEFAWTPTYIFDDGTKTFLVMPIKIQEMPVLLINADDKTSSLVTYRVKETEGGMKVFVIDRVFESCKLILGNNEVTIKNKNFRY